MCAEGKCPLGDLGDAAADNVDLNADVRVICNGVDVVVEMTVLPAAAGLSVTYFSGMLSTLFTVAIGLLSTAAAFWIFQQFLWPYINNLAKK